MSCGQNRRRRNLSSTFNSRQHHHRHESPSTNTESTSKIQTLSRSRKSIYPERLSKQISHENPMHSNRFRILDDNGNDVTPRLITDYVRINVKHRHEEEKSISDLGNKRLTENQEPSASEKSVVGTTHFSTTASHMIHTGTLFSAGEKAALDISARLVSASEHLLNRTVTNRTSRTTHSDLLETQAKFLPGLGLQYTDPLLDDVMLSETETIFILDLESNMISQEDHDEYERIKEKNKAYIELSDNRQGNDLYIERGMQTFNDFPKHEHINTDPVLTRSQQSWANLWDMYDSQIEADQHEGKIYRQHVIRNIDHSNDEKFKSNEHQHGNVTERITSNQSSKVSSSQNSSAILSKESILKITSSKTNCFTINNENIDKLPDIDVDALIMERILNSSKYLLNRTIDQNNRTSMNRVDNRESRKRRDLSLIEYSNLRLERLWNYSCYLTRNRNVSCLCWSEYNHDLLAVGYGKFQYNDDKEGLVCCWNGKNAEFPERYYQTDAGVTSLSFSHKRFNLLAVGLFNGVICVFDLNHNNIPPIVTTNNCDNKHTDPVWQIEWNESDRLSELSSTQTLLSISSDGRVIQWILRKEFEGTDLIHLKSFNPSKTICQAFLKNDGQFTNLVDGLCFDIRSNDRTTYLCGTIEGVIHRCSTIYNEKYLESYIGHTGPVYKIHWSPFVENIFLSASADWTVRLWMVGFNQSCMIFSSTNCKMFFDAIWSPKSATMFFCVNETMIEIWDLSKSILDPISVAHCPDQFTLTSIAYATDTDCILVGTSDGAVWVYHLENLSTSTNANDLNTIVQQSLVSQIDSREKSLVSSDSSSTIHDEN